MTGDRGQGRAARERQRAYIYRCPPLAWPALSEARPSAAAMNLGSAASLLPADAKWFAADPDSMVAAFIQRQLRTATLVAA